MKRTTFFALTLITLAIFSRLLPHPSNVTPLVAVSLMSGAYLSSYGLGLAVPLVSLVMSDFFLGFHSLSWLVYLCFVLFSLISRKALKDPSAVKSVMVAIACSLSFFLISNLGVFLFSTLYPKTWQGFWTCYWLALPFLRNSLLGDVGFTVVLFTLYRTGSFFLRADPYATSPR